MIWIPIQSTNAMKEHIERIADFLESYNSSQPNFKVTWEFDNESFFKITCSQNGQSTYFQITPNKKPGDQGTLCLIKEGNLSQIIFARKLKFNKLFFPNDNNDHLAHRRHLFTKELKQYLHEEIEIADENLNEACIKQVDQRSVSHKTRFLLFNIPADKNEQGFHLFACRLRAFLIAKQIVETGKVIEPLPPPPLPTENMVISDIRSALTTYRNVILEGVPGTGKTWHARELTVQRKNEQERDSERIVARWITFHPAVAYEDFVEGIRPGADRFDAADQTRNFWDNCQTAEDKGFNVRDGFFLRVCREARIDPNTKYLVVIDEINRANLPNVLGDLLTLLEKDKRVRFDENGKPVEASEENWVTLPYSGRRFAVPDNVYVLGTMNTSDKSIAPIDAALRRRFAFLSIEPMPTAELNEKVPKKVRPSVEQWDRLNVLLADCLGHDGRLGHSYLLQLGERVRASNGIAAEEAIRQTWQLELLPQLIDTLTTHGAIELLAQDNGANWLAARGKNDQDTVVALRNFLERLSLGLQLQGDGFGKGLRVVDLRSDEPSAWPANEDEAGEPRVAAE